MGGTVKMGMGAVIFGVLVLVVGLVLSDIIIDGVNRQGARVGCYTGDDVPIRNATGPSNTTTAAPVPSKVSANYRGPDVIGKACGTGTVTATAAFASSTCVGTATQCGTVRYALEVYGADSLNNLITLVYWIVLIGLVLAMVGGGGAMVARGARY